MMMWSMVLWIPLLIVLVWAAIYWLGRRTNVPRFPGADPPENPPSALEILRQRYARGEIDTAMFEQQALEVPTCSPPTHHLRSRVDLLVPSVLCSAAEEHDLSGKEETDDERSNW